MAEAARQRDRSMRKVAASLFRSLAGGAEQQENFVGDVEDITEPNLMGVSR
jgi:hypothetical protein